MKKLAIFAAAWALLFAPAAQAAIIVKSYLFTATTVPALGPTPVHTGSFSFSYDDATLAANLISIDYQIGATVYDTSNAAIGPDSFDGQLMLYGSLNGTSIYPGTDDFWLVFNPTTDTGVVFRYSQVGYEGFASSGAESTILVNTVAAPVPEPAAWAMMIAGFGLTGAALRRRRPLAATAA